MKPFDIFITCMEWEGGGKKRPVLAFILGDDTVDVYKISTRHRDKSGAIKALYFKIDDWAEAGPDRQSYVDTGTLITLATATFESKTPIGRLTDSDKLKLLEFLIN